MVHAATANANAVETAAQVVRQGGVVAYPTEGVFGLGCDPFNELAVMRLLALKGRDVDKGLIVLGDSIERCAPLLDRLTPSERSLVLDTWPGSCTWLLPNAVFPKWVVGDHDRVAIRVTAHPVAQALCALSGGWLVSTSANVAGEPPMQSVADVSDLWSKQIDAIVAGELTHEPGRTTSIRDACSGAWLRR